MFLTGIAIGFGAVFGFFFAIVALYYAWVVTDAWLDKEL